MRKCAAGIAWPRAYANVQKRLSANSPGRMVYAFSVAPVAEGTADGHGWQHAFSLVSVEKSYFIRYDGGEQEAADEDSNWLREIVSEGVTVAIRKPLARQRLARSFWDSFDTSPPPALRSGGAKVVLPLFVYPSGCQVNEEWL